jgi:hypothetical protein
MMQGALLSGARKEDRMTTPLEEARRTALAALATTLGAADLLAEAWKRASEVPEGADQTTRVRLTALANVLASLEATVRATAFNTAYVPEEVS